MEIKIETLLWPDYRQGEIVTIKRFTNLDDTDNQRLKEIITKFYDADWATREAMHRRIVNHTETGICLSTL